MKQSLHLPHRGCTSFWLLAILLLALLPWAAQAQTLTVAVSPAGPLTLCMGSTQTLTATATVPGFNVGGSGFNSIVRAEVEQADGKVLVGGQFTSYNGQPAGRLLRLNPDGSLDTDFNAGGSGANNYVNALAVQVDGKVLVGGQFSTYNGQPAPYLMRLNADGSRDTGFNAGGSGPFSTVLMLAVQADSKVLVGGTFDTYNSQPVPYLLRLNPDGSLDTSFNAGGSGATDYVYALAVQPDGKVLVGGQFNTYNGQLAPYLVRLNADGSRDTGFNAGGSGANDYVNVLALQADGKILAGGNFTSYGGQAAGRLLRLNADGSRDMGFNAGGAGTSGTVNALAVQADGKALAGGIFTTYNGQAVGGVLRLNADGSRDMGFNAGGAGTSGTVNALAVQADGKVLIGGNFSRYNDQVANRLLRVNADGSPNDGTVSGLSYRWSNGASGASIIVSQPGDYQVTASTTSYGTSYSNVVRVNAAVTAGAQNVAVTLAADGTAIVPATAVNNGSSSPCGAVTLALAPATFTCANLGANAVTLTVTAPDGTTATAQATVTVSAPSLTSTTWTGAASSDWGNCANWSFGQLPTAAISAMVPAGLTTYPALPAGTFATNNLSVASGATLRTDAGATLQLSGNLALDGEATFAGPVQLLGATNQTLGGQATLSFATLTLAKPVGTVVQLQRDLPIATRLMLNGGTLATDSYRVALGSSATLSETNTSYVLGNVAATRTLAPGRTETFGGLGLSLTPALGSVAPGLTPVVRTTGTVLTGVGTSQSIRRYFNIQPAVDQDLSVDMVFGYFEHELNNIPAANLLVFTSATTAGPWVGLSPSGRSTDAATASGTVSHIGISSFSSWTLGDAANPLPVTLTTFTATTQGNTAVRLMWATASEVTSVRFEVERSLDGVIFTQIGQVAAAGTSLMAHTYALTDARLPTETGQLYYRLRQVDQDGTAYYSPVRTIALSGAAAGLHLYPNPTAGAATLTGAESRAGVQVLDALGRVLATAAADATGTAHLLGGLPPGVYVVRSGGRTVRLIVE
jgi:uncharacterized delta-60 repeat protein